jgi:NAD(P)-dependent dehydrogenase (short-subunit alcohol dehydrogenase family)
MRKTDVDQELDEYPRRLPLNIVDGLAGKIAIVTGGESGLGEKITIRIAQEEATVIIPDINFLGAQNTQETITNLGGRSLVLNVDVSQGEDVNGMVRKVIDRFGVIYILVNNTGIGVRRTLPDTSEENCDRILAVDLRAVYSCTKYVAPQIEEDFFKCLSREFPGKRQNISCCITLE